MRRIKQNSDRTTEIEYKRGADEDMTRDKRKEKRAIRKDKRMIRKDKTAIQGDKRKRTEETKEKRKIESYLVSNLAGDGKIFPVPIVPLPKELEGTGARERHCGWLVGRFGRKNSATKLLGEFGIGQKRVALS